MGKCKVPEWFKKWVPRPATHEAALLRDIRTLLAFQLQHDIYKCEIIHMFDNHKKFKENAEWALEYIKQNRIL